jgi:hypothetical protein
MPTNTTLTALPATSVKRKTRDEDEGSGDEGSDVVSLLFQASITEYLLIILFALNACRVWSMSILTSTTQTQTWTSKSRCETHLPGLTGLLLTQRILLLPPSIALKRLLRQLLSSDAEEFDIHALAQLVLTQAVQMGIGSTVKVDGTESDPYAYLSVVDLSACAVSCTPLAYSRITPLPWLTTGNVTCQ